MSNGLVKMLSDEDGEPVTDNHWHLIWVYAGSPALLCSGEVFGFDEGEATTEEKTVARGGITCPRCLDFIKGIKSIKL